MSTNMKFSKWALIEPYDLYCKFCYYNEENLGQESILVKQ